MKILVVDDDQLALASMTDRLRRWGHQVAGYESPLDSLQALAEEADFDLVVTDWVMPESDGLTLARAVRQLDSEHRVFVVMLTSRSDTEQKVEALASGVDWFLTKPVDEAELEATLMVARRQVEMQAQLTARVDELVLARQAAEEAAQAKQDFLAHMSHELRTPMQAVLTTLDILKGTTLQLEQLEILNLAEGSARGLLRILNDILDFSKVESEMMTFLQTNFYLSRVVYDALAPLRLRALEKGLAFECTQTPGRDSVKGDPGRLSQILVNLVGNALKFTDEGSVKVRALHRGTKTWRVEIQDTGPGIPAESLEQVFDPFVQVKHHPSKTRMGTGLGLPLCRAMARRMGGSLTLKSEPGVGTTAILELPLGGPNCEPDTRWEDFQHLTYRLLDELPDLDAILKQIGLQSAPNPDITFGRDPQKAPADTAFVWLASSPQAALLADHRERVVAIMHPPVLEHTVHKTLLAVRSHGQARKPKATSQARILLVDDNVINRKVMAIALEKHGLEVILADDGKAAYSLCQEESFDLVFMDLEMPVMNGPEATAAIRSWERSEGKGSTPIIGLTAHTQDLAEKTFLAAGADGILTKPVAIKDMLEVLGTRGRSA